MCGRGVVEQLRQLQLHYSIADYLVITALHFIPTTMPEIFQGRLFYFSPDIRM